MHIIALAGVLATVMGLTGTSLWRLFRKLDEREEKMDKMDRKISLMGNGIQVIMQELDALDAERFQEALDRNGFSPEDFRKD